MIKYIGLSYSKNYCSVLEKILRLQYYLCLNFVNTLKKEREQEWPEDKYPWLEPDDEWSHMTDRKILDKYINLDNSCLHGEEKGEVMDMLFSYKEAFSLRDEIGTCPNIEGEIDVTDKLAFL